jgi:hypothetical protein
MKMNIPSPYFELLVKINSPYFPTPTLPAPYTTSLLTDKHCQLAPILVGKQERKLHMPNVSDDFGMLQSMQSIINAAYVQR